MVTKGQPGGKQKLRSRAWFDNPDNPGMTALYLERYPNYGLTLDELRSGKPIIGIAQTGSDLSPCNRHHLDLAKRVRDGITAGGVLRSNSRFIPSRKPANAPLPLSTAISLTLVSLRYFTVIRSTASFSPPAATRPRLPASWRPPRSIYPPSCSPGAHAQRLVPWRAYRLRHGRVEISPGSCRRQNRL